jgi:hypothetical protein
MGGPGSGPRPKSTAVHVLNGTYRSDRQGRRPKPRPGQPVAGPPDHLELAVQGVWRELSAQATVTSESAAGFEVLCCMMAEYRADPRRMGATRVAVLRALLNDFGMTTAARERLGTKAPQDDTTLGGILG